MGRGLSSLIRPSQVPPQAEVKKTVAPILGTDETPEGYRIVPIEKVRANPRQPRKKFDEKSIQELAQSIVTNGVLQPLLVKQTPIGFEIIAGERRYRAAKIAGLKTLPVVIKNISDRDQLEVALVENLQRSDLNPIEEAKGYDRLANEFTMTQEEIAGRVGKERSTISNLVRLLKLSPLVQEMLSENKITFGHARALLALPHVHQQDEFAKDIVKNKWSVRKVEQLTSNKPKKVKIKPAQSPLIRSFCEQLQHRLGTKIEIKENTDQKSGEIKILYFHPQELSRICKALLP